MKTMQIGTTGRTLQRFLHASLQPRGEIMSTTEQQEIAAHEFYGVIIDKLTNEKGVHALAAQPTVQSQRPSPLPEIFCHIFFAMLFLCGAYRM